MTLSQVHQMYLEAQGTRLVISFMHVWLGRYGAVVLVA